MLAIDALIYSLSFTHCLHKDSRLARRDVRDDGERVCAFVFKVSIETWHLPHIAFP